MKKLLIVLFVLLSPLAQADRFGGTWKHHLRSAEGLSIRLSFKEARVAPSIGLPRGGRIAYQIYIDVWGGLESKSVDYRFVSSNTTRSQEFEGTLIKENAGHQYAQVTLNDEQVYLMGNRDHDHLLEITIEGREYSFPLEL